nr:MAG TPA: hypothetical protein [Microviridae sp.]
MNNIKTPVIMQITGSAPYILVVMGLSDTRPPIPVRCYEI